MRFIVRAIGVVPQHSVHNARPALLSNEAAQCKTVVRSAWHNGFAAASGAIPAWHNGFGIVRIFFDGIF